jgi:hypothetical protein
MKYIIYGLIWQMPGQVSNGVMIMQDLVSTFCPPSSYELDAVVRHVSWGYHLYISKIKLICIVSLLVTCIAIGVDFHRQQGSSTPNNFNAGQTPYRLALLALAISPCHLLWMGLGTLNIFSKSTPLCIAQLAVQLVRR